MVRLLFVLYFAIGSGALAQTKTPVKPAIKPPAAKPVVAEDTTLDALPGVTGKKELPLVVKEATKAADFVTINYSTPYDGMVELRLFDANLKQIYFDQVISPVGDHSIRLKASAFKPGTSYNYSLTFKGKTTPGKLSF